jgi:carboxylate-amine ligase
MVPVTQSPRTAQTHELVAAAAEVTGTAAAPTLGVEEEFHVIDLHTRELVPRAGEILDRLSPGSYSAELHRSVVESNSAVCGTLDELRTELVGLREAAAGVAERQGLGLIAAGTVPLVDTAVLAITPTTRYRRMLDDYQMLVREQLICGAQVHVGVADRDLAVVLARAVTPWLPVLLALSASSPYWMGEDSGYASTRSLLWSRWPTAGDPGPVGSAAEHDALVADLVASGTIRDQAMIYFDVRPSAHVPTIELRVTDACPRVDDVILLAGLFRALVAQEAERVAEQREPLVLRPPLHRAALWRAARSGLEGDLVLPDIARPVPAAEAVRRLLAALRPYLTEAGDWARISELATEALARGSSAARQRRVYERRGRLSDVVDFLVAETRGVERPEPGAAHGGPALPDYARAGDEVFGDGPLPADYEDIVRLLRDLGPDGLRQREDARDEEQRSRGVTFGVSGEATTRLFPFDLIPRVVPAEDWQTTRVGLVQRARALDAFLHDVYGARAAIEDGVIPAWVVDGSPGLRPTGALMDSQPVRAHVIGTDLVRDAQGDWFVLEDNLRVPSGIGYAMQNRRLTEVLLPELRPPAGLLPVDDAPEMLLRALYAASPPGAADREPAVVLLSSGPSDSAWFEHELLAGEMGVPLVRSTDLLVEDGVGYRQSDGGRHRVDVIYMRMDEDGLLHAPGADGRPLGAPLLSAVHGGSLALANALGNGVGDDKAVYAYVPRLVEYYLGEKPLLADVPTFLCGLPEHCDEALRRMDDLVFKPVDGYGGERVLIGPLATERELAAVRRQVLAAPHRWVAQEVVSLSTHPVFDGSGLNPRHVDLRAFVFLGDHPEVAPVALTRVAPAGSMVVNSSRGGGSKDTWLFGPAL